MTEEEISAWKNGYLIACCNLVLLHDEPCLANDVLMEASITKADIKRMDLTETDKSALRKVQKARKDDPII